MKIWRTSLASTSEDVANNRRRHGRLKTEDTECSLGHVVDISGSGMRVERKGALPVKVGDKFRIDLQIASDMLELAVAVRRVQKMGRRKFEYGLEFVGLDDRTKLRLANLARTAATAARSMW